MPSAADIGCAKTRVTIERDEKMSERTGGRERKRERERERERRRWKYSRKRPDRDGERDGRTRLGVRMLSHTANVRVHEIERDAEGGEGSGGERIG